MVSEETQRKVHEWLAYAEWPLTLRKAGEVTDCAVATRYPAEATGVMAHDAQRAIELTEQVRAQVRAALRELGMESF